jgi:hypothetical protein
LNVNASVSSGPTNITQINSAAVSATNGLPVSGNNGGSLVVIGVDSSGRLILVPNTAFNMAQIAGVAPGLDNTNELRVSLYGKATNPGDTPFLLETLGALAGVSITEDTIRNLTMAGKAFSATTTKITAPGTATLGFQLFNPASSGKNLLIYSVILNMAAITFHDFRMTTADVSSITGWTNTAITPVNNKGGGAASVATCGYSNTNLTGSLLGSAREVIGVPNTQSIEALTNGEVIFLPASASVNGIAIYINATGANNWAVTVEYLEF